MASTLVRGEYLFVLIVILAGAGIVGVSYATITLTADEAGIRIRNWIARTRVPWADVTDITLSKSSRWGQRQRFIVVTARNGQRVKSYATATGDGGRSPEIIDELLRRLIVMRREQLGIADPPELAAALKAAERGDPGPIGDLLASGAIDMATYEQRLHDLADEGRIDLEAFRRARRDQLTWGSTDGSP